MHGVPRQVQEEARGSLLRASRAGDPAQGLAQPQGCGP